MGSLKDSESVCQRQAGSAMRAGWPTAAVLCALMCAAWNALAASPVLSNLRQLTASSRRTGLIVSEIMYHPPARPDSNNLEFIELFNTEPVDAEIGGYRIEGDIAYTFPAETILSQRSFAVVAKDPAALGTEYGIAEVSGPFSNSLNNGGATVRLINDAGEVLLEVRYDDRDPWPASADGCGHSLVLAQPDYGEGDARAWRASTQLGGTPGTFDPFTSEPLWGVCINEVLASTNGSQTPFIELYNHSTATVDLTGWFLGDRSDLMAEALPAGTVLDPGGLVAITPTGIVLDARGGMASLYDSTLPGVVDAVKWRPCTEGCSSGRLPDGSGRWAELADPSPGLTNGDGRIDDIVINELMFHPISDDDRDEYIELFNKGTADVDIGSWAFTDGIDFTMPPGTVVPAGGYLVVAKDAVWLLECYTNLLQTSVVGDYGGTLSDRGERVRLARPANPALPGTNMITVDEVTYRDGGQWGTWTDGGGSSLELIDPRSDNALAANWADSIETGKSEWCSICCTGRLDNGVRTPNELQVLMLGAGESLVDDLSVVRLGETLNRVPNGSFESGTAGWLIEGNHVYSHQETNEGWTGSASLHLIATGGGDNIANRIETDLSAALVANQDAIISLQARWLSGNRRIVARLFGNWLEAAGALTVPRTLGTPGAANSCGTAHAGPAIEAAAHAPVLPVAGQAVTVTARISDPDGVASAVLQYRLDPSALYSAQSMTDDGVAPDLVAGDGVYSATIPGQGSNTLAAFYVEAVDMADATNTFPKGAPAHECLVRFGDGLPVGLLASIKLWYTWATVNAWTSRKTLSNDPLEGTLAYGPFRAVYGIGARYHGSPWVRATGNPTVADCSYSVYVPSDDRLLGATSFMLDRLERDGTYTRERMSYWIGRLLGVPYVNQRYLHVYFNGRHKGVIYSDAQQPNGDFLDAWYPGMAQGDLFEFKDWFEHNDTDPPYYSDQIADANMRNYTTVGGAKKQERYRWTFDKKPRSASDDDFSRLFALVDAVNSVQNYGAVVEPLVDVEEWMREFAWRHIVSDWDGYSCDRGKNCYLYKPDLGRWQIIQWDLDMALGAASDTDYSLFTINDPILAVRFFGYTPFLRRYWRTVNDAVYGPLMASQFDRRIDQLRAALVASGASPTPASTTAVKTWISNRRNWLLNQLNTVTASFAITTHKGTDFATTTNVVVIEGTSPVDVDTIRLNGAAHPASWLSVTQWRMTVGLLPGPNLLEFQGVDPHGAALAGMTDSVVVTYLGTDTLPPPQLVINEIMFNPAKGDAEFVELYNASSFQSASLADYSLGGVSFVFVTNATIGPDSYAVLAENADGFHLTYGNDIPLAGQYAGKLSNEGETLTLWHTDPSSGKVTLIDEVTYGSAAPWPCAANGTGPSLQLINPFDDNNRVGNWAVGSAFPFTPGKLNMVGSMFDPLPEVWINEIQTLNGNTSTDRFGDAGPWLEVLATAPPAAVTSSVILLPEGSVWRYLDNGSDQGTAWRAPVFNDAAWKSGPARLGYGGDGEVTPVSYGSDPNNTYPCTYFRTTFVVTHTAQVSELILDLVRDDGAVVYLNGTEVRRDNMNPGEPGYRDYANATVGGSGELEWYPTSIAPAALVIGTNVIAVEIHQCSATSSDIGLDLMLTAFTIEHSEKLAGYFLSDDPARPCTWTFPANAMLPEGEYKVVWADGATGKTSSTEWHTSFSLGTTGALCIARVANGRTTVVDFTTFGDIALDRSFGCLPNGDPYSRRLLYLPTPGAPNVASNPVWLIRINEWMADNTNTIADPADGKYSDWFELYNADTKQIDLGGFLLGDSSHSWPVPAGTRLNAATFLLVWADGDDDQNDDSGDLHVPFQLGKDGDELSIASPDGYEVDHVIFGAQQTDVTEGRFPDGAPATCTLDPPTPGGPNSLPEPAAALVAFCVLALRERHRAGKRSIAN